MHRRCVDPRLRHLVRALRLLRFLGQLLSLRGRCSEGGSRLEHQRCQTSGRGCTIRDRSRTCSPGVPGSRAVQDGLDLCLRRGQGRAEQGGREGRCESVDTLLGRKREPPRRTVCRAVCRAGLQSCGPARKGIVLSAALRKGAAAPRRRAALDAVVGERSRDEVPGANQAVAAAAAVGGGSSAGDRAGHAARRSGLRGQLWPR
mmetsp:Transcript_11866/g.32227  ORF Transcript_11866/g.32227 Transcript_11866/m.32227 type:complete len:203 (+) Transcript_11866:183-791(+)